MQSICHAVNRAVCGGGCICIWLPLGLLQPTANSLQVSSQVCELYLCCSLLQGCKDALASGLSVRICKSLPRVDGHRFRGVVGFVDAHKTVCQLKHVIPQADDDKLCILGALLDIVRHN